MKIFERMMGDNNVLVIRGDHEKHEGQEKKYVFKPVDHEVIDDGYFEELKIRANDVDCKNIEFIDCDLTGVDLSFLDVEYISFWECKMAGVILPKTITNELLVIYCQDIGEEITWPEFCYNIKIVTCILSNVKIKAKCNELSITGTSADVIELRQSKAKSIILENIGCYMIDLPDNVQILKLYRMDMAVIYLPTYANIQATAIYNINPNQTWTQEDKETRFLACLYDTPEYDDYFDRNSDVAEHHDEEADLGVLVQHGDMYKASDVGPLSYSNMLEYITDPRNDEEHIPVFRNALLANPPEPKDEGE